MERSGSGALLLEAAVSRLARARSAWARWSADHDLDSVSWQEMRLLGAVAARSRELEVRPELRPRLEGIRRFVWSATQSRIAGARPVLSSLGGQGVTVCLLKGAALVAGRHLAAGERFMRDVDLLVPREQLSEAVEALLALGWRAAALDSHEEVFSLAFPRLHALGFTSAADPEHAIDLHVASLPLNRFVASDAGLWERSREVRLFGVLVRCPSAEDLLCGVLAHSYLSDPEQGSDWAVDASALLRGAPLDWKIFFRETQRRGLEALVLERLRELRALEACELPPPLRDWLASARPDPVFRGELEALRNRGAPARPSGSFAPGACSAERARRLGAAGREKASPLPAPLPWLRADVPLPAELAASGPSRRLRISGRIRGASKRGALRFRVYCGSLPLGGGHAVPVFGRGRRHSFDVRLAVDPTVLAAEGESSLSLYFGRRSRDAGVLGPDSELTITRLVLD